MPDYIGSDGFRDSSGREKNPICYIYDIPLTKRRELTDYCDQVNLWKLMAQEMGFSSNDIDKITRCNIVPGYSPSAELLKIWGGRYNHKITELYGVLYKLKMVGGMRIIIDYVPQPYKNLVSSTNENIPFRDQDQFNTEELKANVKEITRTIPEATYEELSAATQKWNTKLLLGKGGFGSVYRGFWRYTDVAIKQIDYKGNGDREAARVQLRQSINELNSFKFHHLNVLPLYAYCLNGEKPCLIYEYMSGGSLKQKLRPSQTLTWNERINICQGVACGINYLHTVFKGKPLIHGDIKPDNILLDRNLSAKIADFGLARQGPNAINEAVQVSKVFGTRPYLPEEYIKSKQLSTKVDTFSFGVVLLETFTGLPSMDKEGSFLKTTIRTLLESNNNMLENLIDKRIEMTPLSLDVCKRSIDLGLVCIKDAEQRPEMERVLLFMKAYWNSNKI